MPRPEERGKSSTAAYRAGKRAWEMNSYRHQESLNECTGSKSYRGIQTSAWCLGSCLDNRLGSASHTVQLQQREAVLYTVCGYYLVRDEARASLLTKLFVINPVILTYFNRSYESKQRTKWKLVFFFVGFWNGPLFSENYIRLPHSKWLSTTKYIDSFVYFVLGSQAVATTLYRSKLKLKEYKRPISFLDA